MSETPKGSSVLEGMAILLLFQLAGEVFIRILAMPVAGLVAGMGLLFAALGLRVETPQPLETTSGALLLHFALLFVPASVGVLVHVEQLATEWLPISVAHCGARRDHGNPRCDLRPVSPGPNGCSAGSLARFRSWSRVERNRDGAGLPRGA